MGFPGDSQVKTPPALQEMQVQFLIWENPQERGNGNPPPVFLPEKSHGQRSLSGYSPQDLKESVATEHGAHDRLYN